MRILITNTHSILNSGDAGIIVAQIQFLNEIFQKPEIFLTSRTPELDRGFYEALGVSTLPPLLPAPSIFSKKSQKIWGSLRNLLSLKDKINLLKTMKRCDLVISSGGGYFYSNRKRFPGPTFFQNYIHLKCAVIFNKPVIFFPQSFGPFYNTAAGYFLKKVVCRKEVLAVFAREEISLMLLKQLTKNDKKIALCPDMAFYLSRESFGEKDLRPLDLPRPIIAMTLRQWRFPDMATKNEREKKKTEYLNAIRETCHYIARSLKGSILVFPQVRGPGNLEDDRIITRQLFEDLDNKIPGAQKKFLNLPDKVDPQSVIQILSQVDLMVATRFHSAIFAMIASIPLISVSYQPKSAGIMKLMGLERFCLDISTVKAPDITKLIDMILADRLSIREKIMRETGRLKSEVRAKLSPSIQPWLSKEDEDTTG